MVNSIRVIKTTKQAMGSKHNVSYVEAIRMVLAADGWKGLFGRGLRTRLLANALQSLVFTVIWRGLADHWGNKNNKSSDQNNRDLQGGTETVDEAAAISEEEEDHMESS